MLPIFEVDSILIPGLNRVKILLEMKRLEIQAVVEIVEKKAELMINISGAEVLRRGAQQNNFVVAAPKIV